MVGPLLNLLHNNELRNQGYIDKNGIHTLKQAEYNPLVDYVFRVVSEEIGVQGNQIPTSLNLSAGNNIWATLKTLSGDEMIPMLHTEIEIDIRDRMIGFCEVIHLPSEWLNNDAIFLVIAPVIEYGVLDYKLYDLTLRAAYRQQKINYSSLLEHSFTKQDPRYPTDLMEYSFFGQLKTSVAIGSFEIRRIGELVRRRAAFRDKFADQARGFLLQKYQSNPQKSRQLSLGF